MSVQFWSDLVHTLQYWNVLKLWITVIELNILSQAIKVSLSIYELVDEHFKQIF